MVEGDYLAQSAQDMADILDTLGIERAAVLARGGTMVLSRFAARWGERMLRAVAVNPEPPSGADRKRVNRAFDKSLYATERDGRWLLMNRESRSTPRRSATIRRGSPS